MFLHPHNNFISHFPGYLASCHLKCLGIFYGPDIVLSVPTVNIVASHLLLVFLLRAGNKWFHSHSVKYVTCQYAVTVLIDCW